MSRFVIFFLVFILIFTMAVSASGGYFTDDRSSILTYSARTVQSSVNALNGTMSRITGSNNVSFEFYGSTLDVWCMRYSSAGSIVDLWIDNVKVDTQTIAAYTSSTYTRTLAFSVSDLDDSLHFCSIVVRSTQQPNSAGTNSTAYFWLDYIETSYDPDLDSDLVLRTLILCSIWLLGFFYLFGNLVWRLKND